MRKLIYFLFIIATGYIAAIFQYRALMLLFVMEIFLVVIMFFIPRILIRNTNVLLETTFYLTEKKKPQSYVIGIANDGRLPGADFGIQIDAGYENGKKQKKKIHFSRMRDTKELSFEIAAPYNGLMEIRINRLRVFDYLSLFSTKKKQNEVIRAAVLPGKETLLFNKTNPVNPFLHDQSEITFTGTGVNQAEIRQIREYQKDDKMRHIHWIQTSKTNELWVKEYEKETFKSTQVHLEIDALDFKSVSRADKFYTLLSSLLNSLIEELDEIKIDYEQYTWTINEEEDIKVLFIDLYQIKLQDTDTGREKNRNGFVINSKLEIYFNTEPVYRWNNEKAESKR